MRVLFRLGVSDGQDELSAMQAASRMNPSFLEGIGQCVVGNRAQLVSLL